MVDHGPGPGGLTSGPAIAGTTPTRPPPHEGLEPMPRTPDRIRINGRPRPSLVRVDASTRDVVLRFDSEQDPTYWVEVRVTKEGLADLLGLIGHEQVMEDVVAAGLTRDQPAPPSGG